jgi:flavin-dependent dehydrogenase
MRPVGDRILAVGDAAGAAAPSNGEGIPEALLTGELAAAAILEGMRSGDFSSERLRGYGTAVRAALGRKFHRAEMARRLLHYPLVMDLIVRIGRDDERVADLLCWMLVGEKPGRMWPRACRS